MDTNEDAGTGSFISDPELYERLAQPVENEDIAQQKANEFYERVCKLREEYGIPEIVIAYSINHKTENGTARGEYHGFRGGQCTMKLIHGLMQRTNFGSLFKLLMTALANEV